MLSGGGDTSESRFRRPEQNSPRAHLGDLHGVPVDGTTASSDPGEVRRIRA